MMCYRSRFSQMRLHHFAREASRQRASPRLHRNISLLYLILCICIYLSAISPCYISFYDNSSLYLHRAAGFKMLGDEDEKSDYVNDPGLRSPSGQDTAKKGLIIAAAGGKEGYQEIIVVSDRRLPDGRLYEGTWALASSGTSGYPHGYGYVTYKNGDTYLGEFSKGRRWGKGKYTWAEGRFKGRSYKGQWENGRKKDVGGIAEFGTYTFASGATHVGGFKGRNQHGPGTKTLRNGDIDEGEWENGKRKVKLVSHKEMGPEFGGLLTYGTYRSQNTNYKGEWKMCNGVWKKHGKGIIYYADGSKYDGYWVEGAKHGKGTQYYTNGSKYDGYWVEGAKHRKGTKNFAKKDLPRPVVREIEEKLCTLRKVAGEILSVLSHANYDFLWQNILDYAMPEKTVYYARNSRPISDSTDRAFLQSAWPLTYSGQWYQGKTLVPSGRDKNYCYEFKLVYPNGVFLSGRWSEVTRSGRGGYEKLTIKRALLKYPDGGQYDGPFVHGAKHGFGKETLPNGEVYEGLFQNGKQTPLRISL